TGTYAGPLARIISHPDSRQGRGNRTVLPQGLFDAGITRRWENMPRECDGPVIGRAEPFQEHHHLIRLKLQSLSSGLSFRKRSEGHFLDHKNLADRLALVA